MTAYENVPQPVQTELRPHCVETRQPFSFVVLTVVAVAAFLPRAPARSPAGRVCLGCGRGGRFSLIEWGIGGCFSVLLQKYRAGLAVIAALRE